MLCLIQIIGLQVWIAVGIQIVNESTKRASITKKRIEGTITGIDREKHNIKVYVPETKETIILDAQDVREKYQWNKMVTL